MRPFSLLCNGVNFPECRAFLARRRGARSLRRSSGRRGRDGALKTDWTKPWHGGASYGDRMAPVMVSRCSRASRRARLCGANSHNGMGAGLALCRWRDTASAQSVADRFGSKVPPVAWSRQAVRRRHWGCQRAGRWCSGYDGRGAAESCADRCPSLNGLAGEQAQGGFRPPSGSQTFDTTPARVTAAFLSVSVGRGLL
jgi:hypothetical protein